MIFRGLKFTTIFIVVNIGTCQIPKTKKVEEVIKLKKLRNESTVVGDSIELKCQTTFYAKHISIEWKTPEHVIVKSVSLKENTNSDYATTSTLIIPKADIQHSGSYICEIIHKQMNYTLATKEIQITIYKWTDNILDVYSTRIQENVEFEIPVKAFPSVSIIGFHKDGKKIQDSSNITLSLKSTNEEYMYNFQTNVVFNYITPDDVGMYEIIFGNKKKSVSHFFKIELSNSINMDFVGINEDDMIAIYKCSAIGNYKPNITWEFKKCVIFECISNNIEKYCCSDELLILKELHHEDRGLQITSYVSVNLTETGILKCSFQDEEDIQAIMYTQNKFEFYFINTNFNTINPISNNTKVAKIDVGYNESVTRALCLSSLYEYTSNVLLYHNGKKINNEHWLHPEIVYYNFLYQGKNVNRLFISYPVEDQLGNLTCQVFTRTGDAESKTIEAVSKNMLSLHEELSLEDLNGGHTTLGEDIKLKCSVTFYRHVDIKWLFEYHKDGDAPLKKLDTRGLEPVNVTYIQNKSEKTIETDLNTYITTSYLTIAQVNSSNTGHYYCLTTGYPIRYKNSIWIKIYDLDETSLIFNQINNFDEENMKIKFLMTAHPSPTVNWFDNHGKEIVFEPTLTSNFLLSLNQILDRRKNNANYEVIFKFKSINTKDFGNYTVVVENKYRKIEYSIQVNVTGTPSAKMDIYNRTTENATFKCSSTAYPEPTIEWYFKKCATLECCLQTNIEDSEFKNKKELWSEIKGLHHISYITVSVSNRGVLVCRSVNSFGENFAYEPILGFDSNEFDISVENPDNSKYLGKIFEFVERDVFKAICAASRSKYSNEFLWLYNDHYHVKELGKTTQVDFLLSSFSTATIDEPYYSTKKPTTKTNYSCSVLTRNDGILKSQNFYVINSLTPFLKISKTNMANNSVQVDSTRTWTFYSYIDGFPTPTIKWYKNNQPLLHSEKFKYKNDGQILEIDYIVPDDEGIYKCEVKNKYYSSVKYSSLNVVIKNPWLYVQGILLSLALCFIAVLAFIKFRTERKVQKKMKLLGLFYLERDSWNKISYKAGNEDDTVLLPFDRKWEIPFENIKIGKRLGSGAFGITYAADVVNFFPNNSIKTVAVKTVNSSSGLECAKALVSELKILSHLGSHVNIVNFLGACTQHIVKDELYIVLEFCSFGNLLEYIKQHSKNFIDQKDYDLDAFDWTSDTNEDEKSKNKNAVSTKDFLIWCFQIARGMEFLGSRKVVHGDLAARNVLLTDGNVVKVCDFGLSKNVYNYGKYIRKSQGPLPLKWMALETIEKGIFSTQSDVWSFGIVLWEFFSLGKTPYPGVFIDENFCNKLHNGYRMEPPATATTKIYQIMSSCWQLNPEMRPSFTDLADQIGAFLEEPVINHYIDMNNPYTLMNKEQFKNGFDYLTMINPIIYQNLGSAHYENFQPSHSSNSTEGKLETE